MHRGCKNVNSPIAECNVLFIDGNKKTSTALVCYVFHFSKTKVNFPAMWCDWSLLCLLWRCPWCNGYHHKIWTWRYEFNSWTRLIAFHIALILLGKVWIQLFSLQLWVLPIVGHTRFFSLGEATSLREGKLWIQTC